MKEPNEPVPNRDGRDLKYADSHLTDIAKFDGSFAPTARPVEPLHRPWYKDREYLIGGWLNPSVWKAAVSLAHGPFIVPTSHVQQFIEAVGTSCIVYVSGNISTTLMSYHTVQIGAYIGISNVFLISVFIYATAALTGGHLNPMISFSAIFAGICPVSRGWSHMSYSR